MIHHCDHRFVDPSFQIHWIRTGCNIFHSSTDDRLSKYRSRRCSISSNVCRFGGYFFHHLSPHVLNGIFQFNLFGYRNAVFGHLWWTKFFADDHISPFWTQCNFHCICQRVHTFLQAITRIHIKINILCHFYLVVYCLISLNLSPRQQQRS